jgi:hypothetical protein
MISNRELRKFMFEPLSWKCARSWLDANPEWLEHFRTVPVEEGGRMVHYLALEIESANPVDSRTPSVDRRAGRDRHGVVVSARWMARLEYGLGFPAYESSDGGSSGASAD